METRAAAMREHRRTPVAVHTASPFYPQRRGLRVWRGICCSLVNGFTFIIRKALCSTNAEETDRLSKLFDVVYFIAKQEMAFAKFSALLGLERRHGVTLCYGAKVQGNYRKRFENMT